MTEERYDPNDFSEDDGAAEKESSFGPDRGTDDEDMAPDIMFPLPRGLNERTFWEFMTVLRMGGSIPDAADITKTSSATMYHWLRNGEEYITAGWDCKKNPGALYTGYVEFYHAVHKARAEGKMRLAQQVWMAANRGNWKAAAWMLERRWPDDYGKRLSVENKQISVDPLQEALEMDPRSRDIKKAELEHLKSVQEAAAVAHVNLKDVVAPEPVTEEDMVELDRRNNGRPKPD